MNLGYRGGADQDHEDVRAYIADRAHLLNKLCTDHVLWRQSLESFGRDASRAATWTDAAGQEHTIAITWPFLDAHRTIIRSVMRDLLRCGAAGRDAVHRVVALQASMLAEGEAGWS